MPRRGTIGGGDFRPRGDSVPAARLTAGEAVSLRGTTGGGGDLIPDLVGVLDVNSLGVAEVCKGDEGCLMLSGELIWRNGETAGLRDCRVFKGKIVLGPSTGLLAVGDTLASAGLCRDATGFKAGKSGGGEAGSSGVGSRGVVPKAGAEARFLRASSQAGVAGAAGWAVAFVTLPT